MNIVDLQNVIGLARKAISIIGDKLPADQGQAAYKSIGEVEVFTRNLMEQQQQQQAAAQKGEEKEEPVVEEVKAETPKKSRRSKKKKESDDDKPVKVNVVEINDDE